VVAIVGRTEVIMPTVKQVLGIATAIALGIMGAGAVGISAIDSSPAKRFTPSKAEFRLNDHQQIRKMLLGREHIELPPR
jgi:hypothetical protein